MTLESNLVERYGPLIPLSGLAGLLDRSPEATRMFLRSGGEMAKRINTAKVRVGRRLYFRTTQIAAVLSADNEQQKNVA